MVNIPIIPNSVSIGAEVDINTVTAINTSVGGISGRLAVRIPKRQFTCTVGPNDVPAVRAMYYTHRCRWPVGIRDWGDFIFEDQDLAYTLGTSGSSTVVLAPLRRLIQPAVGSRYFHQRVLLPDETDTPVVLKVNGTPLSRGIWTFDDWGIAQIPHADVPSGATLTWSGRAFVPVCFLDGTLPITINVQQANATEYGIQSIQQLRLEEIFEEELDALMLETDDSQ